MRQSFLLPFFMIIITAYINLISCNKKDTQIIYNNNNETKEILLSYLLQQKSNDASSESFVDTLISNSAWTNITQSTISKNFKIIYVPLKYKERTTGLTFLFNNITQKVYYSYISEILYKNKPNTLQTNFFNKPIDIITKFYNFQVKDFTGSIRAFNLANNFLWEYGFENGVNKFERRISYTKKHYSNKNETKISSNSLSSQLIQDGCFDTYIVTWYNDGSSDWVYIGTTCSSGTTECTKTIGISTDSTFIKSNCGSSGGGTSGTITDDNIIINNITDPCLKQLISNLQNSNKLTNAIGGILKSVFGVNNKVNLTFNQDDNLKNSRGEILTGSAYQDPLNNNNYYVTLNASALNNYSQERKTLTIFHEILHNYFWYKYSNTGLDSNQHTEILTNYINKMAGSLIDLYPSLYIHPDVAFALCFDDLKTSVGYDVKSINPLVFNNALISYNYLGLNLDNWESIAKLGKFSDNTISPISTQTPCNINQN